MAEKITVISSVVLNPDGAEAMQGYLAGVGPLTAAAGGENLQRYKLTKAIAGEPFSITSTVEFPSMEAAESLFESEAYKALIPLTEKAFKRMNVAIVENM